MNTLNADAITPMTRPESPNEVMRFSVRNRPQLLTIQNTSGESYRLLRITAVVGNTLKTQPVYTEHGDAVVLGEGGMESYTVKRPADYVLIASTGGRFSSTITRQAVDLAWLPHLKDG